MKLLKGATFVCIAISTVLAIVFLVNLFDNDLYSHDGRFFNRIPQLVSIPLFIIFSIIISVKTHQQKGVILFAMFLALLSIDWLLQFLRSTNTDWISFYWVLVTNSITGVVYIKAFQSFPRQMVKEDALSVFPKNKIVSGYINWAIKDYTWIVFPILLVGCYLLIGSDSLSDLFVLITALLGLYVNFKKSTKEERQKILWLFWGMITFTLIMVIHAIVHFTASELSPLVRLLFNTGLMLVLILSLVMSLFFSNTFDTGILIRRTLVDGFIFIIIVLIYNTVEHYFLHWLSHVLEISDVILSSFLSGIFVLAFSPLHHQLMGYLEKKVKKNPVEHH
ncbi:MAG: hypothetical protein ACYC1Q_09450 [Bacteroidia bacterium]